MSRDDTIIVLLDAKSVGVDRLAGFEMTRLLSLRQPQVIIAADMAPHKEIEFPDVRLLPERDHTAPRSPRRSFKKSSKR